MAAEQARYKCGRISKLLEAFLSIIFTGTAAVAQAADAGTALFGGQAASDGTNGPAFASRLAPNGTFVQLVDPLFPANGLITCVAINSSGDGVMGGRSNTFVPYFAIIYPNGQVVPPVSGIIPASGSVQAVASNEASQGLVAGYSGSSSPTPWFAAAITSLGDLIPITGLPISGQPESVAINSAGLGLIGGKTQAGAGFAALIASNGTLTPVSGTLPTSSGDIASVAINNDGVGLLGGYDHTAPFAALMAPNASLTSLTFDISDGFIKSVDINDSGNGLVGGGETDGNTVAYAARLAPNSTSLIRLTGGNLPPIGQINQVAINSAGVGVMGGYYGINGSGGAYAAFVAPDGTVTQITDNQFPTSVGQIYGVAISEAGVAVLGGYKGTNEVPYAALVAPNGTITQFPSSGLPDTGYISCVSAAEAMTPRSIGSYFSAIYSQLAASFTLNTHLIVESRTDLQTHSSDEISLLADSNWDDSTRDSQTQNHQQGSKSAAPNYSIWVAPFGSYIHTNHIEKIPSFTNAIGGALAAFDYHFPHLLVGGGLGYAFNSLQYSAGFGHGKIQEELGCLYVSYQREKFRLSGALWGGPYQFNDVRRSLFSVTSTSTTNGWILSPHFELAVPAYKGQILGVAEPFIMFDWTNSWQRHFTEKGTSGFNLVVKGQYASLLKSEVGVRFHEQLSYSWGKILFEEKVSYINQAPFHFKNATVFFVGSLSPFPVATGSKKTQNLGSIDLRCSILPRKQKYPYGILALRGDDGNSLHAFFASFEIGKKF